MNRFKSILWGLLLAALCEGAVFAYEMPTHFQVSVEAAQKSILGEVDSLADLGLFKPIHDATQNFPSTAGDQHGDFERECVHGNRLAILLLIACGAEFEDAPSDRSLNHFFDPAHRGAALSVLVRDPASQLIGPHFAGKPSPDWILEDQDEIDGQDFSYRDARNYFYKALTLTELSKREDNWGKLFQTLGQIIHHLQDMAQPQHVRNDAHCDDGLQCLPLEVLVENAYHPSRYEKYTKDFAIRQVAALSGTADGDSVYPGPGDAHRPVFDTPRKFFATAGKGIAEFTNHNFVSEGTNFSYENGRAQANYDFPDPVPGPAVSYTVPELFLPGGGIPPFFQYACQVDPARCYMDFYHTEGADLLTQQPFTNTRAASLSIFDFDLQRYANGTGVVQISPVTGEPFTTERIFTLNRFNFDAAHGFLIPRAVAYSAGLINYFFRGRMEISLPEEGVYAIVDHSTLSGIDAAAGFRGFGKIKLKLRNATPNSEPMRGGRLVAVVKFRRNLCYHDDLENSYPPQVNAYASDCRSSREDIVVSGEQAGVTLTDTARPFEFRFTQAVPINATDLRLQVVYRGTLGAETDAVAVATRDITEPTFFTYMNASDYIKIDDKVYTRDQINQSEALLRRVYPTSCVVPGPPRLRADCLNPFPLTMQFSLGTGPIRIEVEDLPPQRLLRIAFLGDADAAVAVARDGICLPLDPEAVDPLRWQETYDADAAQIQQRFPTFQPLRGVWGWHDTSCVSNGDGSDPGTEDDRETAMGPIADKTPYAVTVTGF